MTFGGVYILEHWNLSKAVYGSVFLQLVGCWIRYACHRPSLFWLLWVGQALVGVSQSLINVAPTMLARNWFGDTERSLATSIATLGGILGQGVGFALSGALITKESDIPLFILIEAVIASVVAALVFGLFRGEPPLPPSRVAAEHFPAEHQYVVNLKRFFTNPYVYPPMIAFGIIYGALAAVSTTINQIIAGIIPTSESPYAASLASYLGACSIGSGIAGAISVGIVLDIFRKYKLVAGTLAVILDGVMVWLVLSMHPHPIVPLLYLNVAVLGFLVIAIIPALFETAVEITFPIPEANSTGMLTLMGQILGVTFVPLLDKLTKPDGDMRPGLWVLTACIMFASLLILLTPERTLRLQEERRLKALAHEPSIQDRSRI